VLIIESKDPLFVPIRDSFILWIGALVIIEPLPEVIEEIKKSNHSEKSWETGAVEIINSRMAKHRKLKQEMMYGKYISAVILVLLADPKRRTIPKLTGSKEEIIESLSEGLD
jgi:hypothetical protein